MKTYLLTRILPALLLSYIFLGCTANAATYTFRYAGNWNDFWNWSGWVKPPNPIPAGDQVVIEANCTVNTPVVCNGTLSYNYSPTVTVSAGISFTIGYSGLGLFRVLTNYGTFTANGGFFFNAYTVNNGTMNLNTNLNTTYSIYNYGNLTIGAGANLSFYTFGGYTGTFVNYSSGTFNINGNLIFTNGLLSNSGSTIVNTGASLRANSFSNISITGTLFNSGTITIESSSRMTINTSGFFANSGTTNIANSATGDLLENFGAITNTSTGIIKGKGTLRQNTASVYTGNANSVISPGSATIGKLNINGTLSSFNMGNSVYQCDIGGSSQGISYDWLAVTNNATLTNARLVVNWSSFTPVAGQNYTIMTFGSRTGQFANVTIPPLPGLAFIVIYNAASVVINVTFPLPLRLLSFSGRLESGNHVSLLWKTSDETNVDRFEVQSSFDGRQFTTVAGKTANNIPGQSQYSVTFTQNDAVSFYRLKTVDKDGSYTFSGIIRISKNISQQILIYPNPVKDIVQISLPDTEPAMVEIIDQNGRIVMVERINDQAQTINISGLTAGSYTLRVIQRNITKTFKMLKE